MSAAIDPAERVTLEGLVWLTACVALALVAHLSTLPILVPITVAAAATIRLWSSAHGRDAPPRYLRILLTMAAVGLLFAHFRTFNGLSAGSALLSLLAGLKLLETRSRRDVYVVTMIIYFLGLAALLEGESFWLLAYLIAVCWLTTAALLRVTRTAANSDPRHEVRSAGRYAGRLLAQALPLALVFWLFFPRFAGPLWQMPADNQNADSGLSDSMSPGDITDLAMSDEVAFRAQFYDAGPTAQERYWRGPVLHDFDGHTWRRTDPGPTPAAALVPEGRAYRYKVSLEPHQHNWIFVLDWPASWDLARGVLTNDYMLVQPSAVNQPIDVIATSYSHVRASETLSAGMRRRDTRLPANRSPRTLELARMMRAQYPDDMAYAEAVLDMFHKQPFYYTLRPPRLANDSVDDFLFATKRGFCGHYASAFAALMRAAGIPARVVTGYQGGTFNRFANYWIVRQSDAHAWDEIWIEARGWLRIDPTSAIAPSRVEHELRDAGAENQDSSSRWQRRKPWLADARLRLDVLRHLWSERILRFDQNSQDELLTWLHIPEPDGQKLVMVMATGLALVFVWLTWAVKRDLAPQSTDRAQRAYNRLCGKLAAAGLPRLPHEAAENYAARVATQRPQWAQSVTSLCRRYSTLRYGVPASPSAIREFVAAVRRFRTKR